MICRIQNDGKGKRTVLFELSFYHEEGLLLKLADLLASGQMKFAMTRSYGHAAEMRIKIPEHLPEKAKKGKK